MLLAILWTSHSSLAYSTLNTIHCTVLDTLHALHFILHTSHGPLHTAHFAQHNAQFIWHTVRATFHTALFTRRTAHFKMHYYRHRHFLQYPLQILFAEHHIIYTEQDIFANYELLPVSCKHWTHCTHLRHWKYCTHCISCTHYMNYKHTNCTHFTSSKHWIHYTHCTLCTHYSYIYFIGWVWSAGSGKEAGDDVELPVPQDMWRSLKWSEVKCEVWIGVKKGQ